MTGGYEPLSDNPNVFAHVTTMHGEAIPVTDQEQTVLAEAAARYADYAEAVAPFEVAANAWNRSDQSDEDEFLSIGSSLLGAGMTSVAHSFVHGDRRLVVRFPNLRQSSETEAPEVARLRLLALVRAQIADLPMFEPLVAYNMGNLSIITEEASGAPTDLLTPDEIIHLPDEHIEPLFEMAERMSAANIVLDVDPTEHATLLRGHAMYDYLDGPRYFDYAISEEEQRFNTSGQNFAELAMALIPIGEQIEEEHGFTPEELTARILFLERAYNMLQQRSPNDHGLFALARTAYLLHELVEPGEFQQVARGLTESDVAASEDWFVALGSQSRGSQQTPGSD